MLMAIVSPLHLSVEEDDFLFIGEVPSGKDQGKQAYLNTRFVQENYTRLFSGESYDETLALMQSDVLSTDNLMELLANWVDENCILKLSVEEVAVFVKFYQLTKDPEMISLITEDEYMPGISVARMLLIDGMDTLMRAYRRNPGGA